ncbi:Outer membrane protein assembly factor BamA [Candidatus Terasakiella magnetica]|uniref:Outer membrane protein assembly factor BamA n=1 Tax=Candidatus Terasakiella magnetica TaxID=1867952 RepID=A0A1C3RCQ5_9PROT|nr:outer membrane protein assembly factor BamA [Candidatus Terasakiella magnetica]SCA55028.1 Outer membrane protein assembly factor BamA [Candidatus Terasakiella magnetica]
MKKRNRITSISAGVAFGLTAALTSASAMANSLIEEITIVGAQRVEPETVRTYLTFQEGDNYSSRQLNRSLKKLFATGLFADVTFKREGTNLVINVIENPVINRIAFEGNRKLDDPTLDSEVTLRPRVIYTRTRVQQDVERILTLYRRSGRFAATIEPKVIQLDQNRVDLVFEIEEGDPTGVEKIRVVGNKEYSDSKLLDVVRTRESRWYNFLTADDNYDPDRINYDKELLRRFYLSRGFADFKVTSAVAELSPSREEFFITYTIDEGPRYEIRSVNIENSLEGLQDESLEGVSDIEVGDWYNADEVDDSVEDLIDNVGFQGFPFVKVSPQVDKDTENKQIDLTFNINEGPRVFVERININGNFRTLDKVVRREFQLVEGDALNAAKLKRSKKRINNLNFFENVQVAQSPGSAPDQKIIDVTVEEKSTGSLSVGAGFSTEDGPMVEFGISEANLLGKGQNLSLSANIAAEKTSYNLAFTEPYFLDRELAAGFDLYKTTQEKQDSSSYDVSSLGFALRASYPFSDHMTQAWSYKLDETTIENVASDASSLIKSQEGEEMTSSISHALTYDNRDSRVAPTEGYRLRVSNTVAGLGGTVYYLRNQVTASYYYPLEDQWILSTKGRIGHIVGLGEDVKVQNRYFLGGSTLRGFEDSGVGPRDSSTSDSLGGEYIVNGSTELRFPLGLPNEYQISGVAFSDYGTLTELNPTDSKTIDNSALRASVGLGLSWVSPMGPIGIDWAFPVLEEDHDKTENFRFTFGTRF